MSKPLSSLLGPFWTDGHLPDLTISGLCADSRLLSPGCLFFAIKGLHTDSHDLLPQLLQQGIAAAIIEHAVSDECLDLAQIKGIPLIQVAHTRNVLSHAAAAWHDFPAKKLVILGVTGTDGKSSTVFFTWQLLQKAGIRAGFFSTVNISYGDEVLPNSLRQSTPEPMELHGILAGMVNHGVSHVVMESTSHGLSPLTARLQDVDFLGAAFTNLSHEHLEFHGTYEQYRHDKANLFRRAEKFSIINRRDKEASYFASQAKAPVSFYELINGNTADPHAKDLPPPALAAHNVVGHPDKVTFDLRIANNRDLPCCLNFPGVFNAENIMAALLLVHHATGAEIADMAGWLPGLKPVKGRMCPVRMGQEFTVLVDYAHTPGAFEYVLPLLRKDCRGRLILVFGSAGERDTAKRPMQGAIAAQYADVLVLCNEDPRLEDEMKIIQDIQAGALAAHTALEIHAIPDRYEAMKTAFGLARKNDMVVLFGKGHEQSIILKTGKIPWDDELMAIQALKEIK